MGLTQAGLGERLRITQNSVARMERGLVTITPSMALLIGYVSREAGIDIEASHARRGRQPLAPKQAKGVKPRYPKGARGRRSGKDSFRRG